MPKFFIKSSNGCKIILLNFLLTIIIFFTLTNCTKNTPSSQGIDLVIPKNARVYDDVNISVLPKEPGINSVKVIIENEELVKTFFVKSYPYTTVWKPEVPGIFKVKAVAQSILDGKTYIAESTLIVYDVEPPIVEEIRTIPENPYVGDEILLQIKIKSKNPLIDLNLSGGVTNPSSLLSLWFEKKITTKPGFTYVRLPKVDKSGNFELFVKSETNYAQDSKQISIRVRDIDRTPPEIVLNAKSFYSQNSNVIFTFELYDQVGLKSYKVIYDGNLIDSGEISGKTFSKSINLNKQELGAHSLNIEAVDVEGNFSSFPKTIYVGGTALSFNVELSPSQPTADSSAVIAMVPDEKDVIYSKIVFLVDGKTIATNLAPSEDRSATGFAIWKVEEGKHFVTVYAESKDARAGIAETTVFARDYNGPRFISLKANDVELSKTSFNQVFPGIVNFKLKVFDPGGINLSVKPRLLIKEDEFEGFYRDLEMQAEEVSSDGKTVTFSVSTTMVIGYYYISVVNVQDKSGNTMIDPGVFLLYVQ